MNILIIGLGSIAKKHINAIEDTGLNNKVYALRSSLTAPEIANVTNVYNLEDIGFLPDFVIISNPTNLHYSSLKNIIHFSCPVFIEKPVFDSLVHSDEILQLIKSHNLLTYVACNLRFYDCIKFIKNTISGKSFNKRVNEVNSYCGSYLPDWRPQQDYRMTYSVSEENGGGVHLDLIHELDYLYWIFGKPISSKKIHRSVSSLDISSIDYANYSLNYSGFTANVILNYYRRDPKRIFEIVFEDETWIVDLIKNIVLCNGKIIYESQQKITDTYKVQILYFMDCIRSGKPIMNNISEALNVLKICLEE